jgi:hypothetical protein
MQLQSNFSFKNVNCWKKIYIADIQLRSDISLKGYGYAILEVVPSNCGVTISDIKKRAHLGCRGLSFGGDLDFINWEKKSFFYHSNEQ